MDVFITLPNQILLQLSFRFHGTAVRMRVYRTFQFISFSYWAVKTLACSKIGSFLAPHIQGLFLLALPHAGGAGSSILDNLL